MRSLIFGCLCFGVMLACNSKKTFDRGLFSIGVSNGVLNSSEIDEASGLAASKTNKGMLWVHNDSGDEPRLFLIDDHGRLKATIHLQGVTNRDWEDIAIGPGPKEGVSYLYVGDIGDNSGSHEYKYIYRLEEPVFTKYSKKHPLDTTIYTIDLIKFKLPDTPRDTEAMLIDPETKNIYLFSKREPRINLYSLPYPQSTNSVQTAQFIMQLPFTQVVAADVSVSGNEVLLKTYKDVFYWKRGKNETVDQLLKRNPAHLPYAVEPQGEAIAFDYEGKDYYTVSEEANQKKSHLMFYKRKD